MFPSHGVVIRHPLSVFPSLPRVALGGLPRVHWYYEGAVSSCHSSRRTSHCFAWRYHGSHLFGSLSTGRVPPVEPGLITRWSVPVCHRGSDGISQVPEEPLEPLPCSSTPAGLSASGLYDAPVQSPRTPRRGLQRETFEAQSHGFSSGCLRFAGRVTPPPRKTRFRLLAKLYREGFSPPGFR